MAVQASDHRDAATIPANFNRSWEAAFASVEGAVPIKVTSYNMSSFEDGVIFVHDVEHALEQLSEFGQRLVATIVFQDYTQDEAAEVLHCARRTVCREFPEAVDRISELFLDGGLLNRLPSVPVETSCQEGERGDFRASDRKEAEYISAKYGTISFSICYA